MNEHEPILSYAPPPARSPRPFGVWLAWGSCALGIVNLLWILVGCAGGRYSGSPVLTALIAAGVLASAPIGVITGLFAASCRDRIRLGYAGAALNFLPALYALVYLLAVS